MDLNSPEMIRKVFGEGDAKRDAGLTTPEDIKRYDNIAYDIHGEWNLLDIYHKKDVTKQQPTIISIHGGGWVYGSKDVYQFYGMNLAQRGFTVVNFSYRLAPENPWPAALTDINTVFTWVSEHAAEYKIDLEHLFVVGDSAGAQLASQYLAMLTNTEFQKFYDFKVPSEIIKIKAVALNCGVYDTRDYLESGKDGVLLAYVGDRLEEAKDACDTMKYVTNHFPPAFVMTSYYDFLKENAKPMYDALTAYGIPCEYKMYGGEEKKEIAHVFHLDIKSQEAKECNDDECAFFRRFIK